MRLHTEVGVLNVEQQELLFSGGSCLWFVLFCFIFVKIESHYVAQTSLKPRLSCFNFLNARITDVWHHTWQNTGAGNKKWDHLTLPPYFSSWILSLVHCQSNLRLHKEHNQRSGRDGQTTLCLTLNWKTKPETKAKGYLETVYLGAY